VSAVDRRRRGTGRARLLWLLALATALLAFTPPGRRAVRRLALLIDSRVEGAAEPNARGYARFIAPVLRRLYERVADDAATELAGRRPGGSAARHGRDAGASGDLAILDIGCGPGDLAAMLSERLPEARIAGLDLSPSMVELARRRGTAGGRLSFEVGDVASLPFESGSIDLVVSTLSLHHWPNAGAGFSEIMRVLRPGGAALVYDLRLVTLGAETLPDLARQAGLPASQLRRERLRGGLLASLFIRFRVDRPAGEPAPDVPPAARAAGHARIPAAVAPGEVA
jgi:SAM-dependent methyltransferase